MASKTAYKRTQWSHQNHACHLLAASLIAVTVLVIGGAFLHAHASPEPPAGHHNANGATGAYWNAPQAAFQSQRTAITDRRAFYFGDTVTMPNGLALKVLSVERNWQPLAAVAATYGNEPDGDNPAGREIILVWFQATNTSTAPIVYSSSMFSLLRTNMPEQRVAVLASLLPTSYGDYGVEPWLLPGQSKTTFVPFLVTIGEQPVSFQYYVPPSMPAQRQPQSLPTLVRLSVLLRPPSGRSVGSFVFQGDETITVTA